MLMKWPFSPLDSTPRGICSCVFSRRAKSARSSTLSMELVGRNISELVDRSCSMMAQRLKLPEPYTTESTLGYKQSEAWHIYTVD